MGLGNLIPSMTSEFQHFTVIIYMASKNVRRVNEMALKSKCR